MNAKQIATLLATALFATAAYSGEKEHHKMEIKVTMDDGDGETHLILDSDDMGFMPHELQVGENRSIVDKEGRPILITRTEDGVSFEVDGKTIDMPAPHEGQGMRQVWVKEGDAVEGMDIDVHVLHDGMPPKAMMKPDGVMIVSGKEIDAATQQLIRTTLESAGHENVHFADGHDGGPHQVHVLKKVVEVSE